MENIGFLLVAVIHVIVSLVLITFVLLQNPKGGALGMLGGQSSSKSVFGATGASDFLITVTKWCIIIFAITSIQLAYMTSKKGDSVVLDSDLTTTTEEPPDTKTKENPPPIKKEIPPTQ